MSKPTRPADVIESYRRNQERRFRFSLLDIAGPIVLALIILASGVLIYSQGESFMAAPTPRPSATPTETVTPTVTIIPTESVTLLTPPTIAIDSTATVSASPALPTQTPTLAVTETPTETQTPTETATITPTPLPARTYTVKQGDTLGYIALLYGISVQDLLQANNLTDTSLLQIGQVLVIPYPATATPTATP